MAFVFTTWPAILSTVLDCHYITVLCAVGVGLAFLAQGARGRLWAYLGLRHLLVYPPVWIAGVFGAAALVYGVATWSALRVLMKVPEDNAALLGAVAFWFTIVVFAGALLLHGVLLTIAYLKTARALRRHKDRQPKTPPEGAKALLGSWDKLHAWLRQDAAIESSEDDVLGHREVARRIARRFDTPREEVDAGQSKEQSQDPGFAQLPSQAVVGALGSGKTTVRYLVDQELAPDLRMVPVDLWPYHTPEAAVEGVLRSLIDAVAKETNVLAVRGIPAGYLRAMGSAGTLPSVVASLVDPAPNPFDTLESIDNLAVALGVRFVVWIEDLERFSAATKKENGLPDALRMAPICSLLFGLSRRRSITVITATIELQARFDLEKVARYIEELAPIEPSTGVPIIRAVRTQCLQYFAAPSRLQSEWDKFNAVIDDDVRDAMANKTFSLPRAVITLARTPRTLKQGLRRTWDAWQRLAGEIDFDDLLLMSLLREAQPDVFALIRDNWSSVAGAGYSHDVRKKAKETFEQLRLGRAELEGDTLEAVRKVMAVVFEDGKSEETVQGLRHKRYWKRFMSEPEVVHDDSDQVVLRTLAAPDDLAILELLEGPRHELVERFARQLSPERLLRLLTPLVPRRVPESAAAWYPRHDPPGLVPLWRMIADPRRSERTPQSTIAEHVERALVLGIENLALVHAIEHYFCGTGAHSPLYVDLDGALAERVRQTLWRLLLENYAGKPSRLVRGLRGAMPAVLPFLVWGSLRHSTNQRNEEPFQGWNQLAITVLEAARQDPMAMLPHLAALVVDGTPTLRGKYEYTFNAERARLLFGDEAYVLELVREPTAVASEAEAVVSAMREAALHHFEHQSQPVPGSGNL